jgi:hypothetical protein
MDIAQQLQDDLAKLEVFAAARAPWTPGRRVP